MEVKLEVRKVVLEVEKPKEDEVLVAIKYLFLRFWKGVVVVAVTVCVWGSYVSFIGGIIIGKVGFSIPILSYFVILIQTI